MLPHMVGIFVLQLASGTGAPVNAWLVSFDPDAFRGRGGAEFTHDPSKAKRFVDAAAAWAYWKTPSKVRPFRPDGQANRPLTAYTVSIQPLPDVVVH